MESSAPEFAQYWLPSQAPDVGDKKDNRRDNDAQQAALEALADRVSAARSVF